MASLVPEPLQKLRALYVSRLPRTERNSTNNTRSNISRHYDLSNAMFEQFLDETMSYSSGLFDPETLDAPVWSDLATAQVRKIERLLDQAGVGEGTRVLEIGTGWGELAIRAAHRGATVHSVTLSKEQQGLARRRVREAGVADRVTVELKDYREVRGQYDAVVSVEMIEAVGYEYWPTYFRTLDAVLAPGGAVAIQAITMPHDRMLATRNTYTWVHKYIFPGGFLPSTEAIEDVTRTHTTLRVADRLSLGESYAQTLRLWDERFVANAGAVGRLGFDAIFRRMWHFYLEYSRAGFALGLPRRAADRAASRRDHRMTVLDRTDVPATVDDGGVAARLATALAPVVGGELPVRLTAWDGSVAGPKRRAVGRHPLAAGAAPDPLASGRARRRAGLRDW